MKILAVDYGASRTGLAVCDPTEFREMPDNERLMGLIREKLTEMMQG